MNEKYFRVFGYLTIILGLAYLAQSIRSQPRQLQEIEDRKTQVYSFEEIKASQSRLFKKIWKAEDMAAGQDYFLDEAEARRFLVDLKVPRAPKSLNNGLEYFPGIHGIDVRDENGKSFGTVSEKNFDDYIRAKKERQ